MFNQESFSSPLMVDKVLKKNEPELPDFFKEANLTTDQLVELQKKLRGAFLRDEAKRDRIIALISQILGDHSIKLIESLVEDAKRFSNDPLHPEKFLQENEGKIDLAVVEVQRKIEQKILKMIEAHPEILQMVNLLELKNQTLRTGHLPSSSRRLLVHHAMSGTTPPPLKERELPLPGKEVQQVPNLKIQYLLKVGSGVVVGSEAYENYQLLSSVLANLNLNEMNAKFKEHGFRVNSVEIELKIVMVGSYGSQVGSINETLSSDSAQTAKKILTQFQNLINEIQNIQDDGLGLGPDSRIIMAIDESFNNENYDLPTIPIIDSHILWYADVSSRKSAKKTSISSKSIKNNNYISALVYDHPDGQAPENLLIEKELRVS